MFILVGLVSELGGVELYVRKMPVTWVETLSMLDDEFVNGLSAKSVLYLGMGGGPILFRFNSILADPFSGGHILMYLFFGVMAILAFYKGKSVPPEQMLIAAVSYMTAEVVRRIDEKTQMARKKKLEEKASRIRNKVLASTPVQALGADQEGESSKSDKKGKLFSFGFRREDKGETEKQTVPEQGGEVTTEEDFMAEKLRRLRVVQKLKEEAQTVDLDGGDA